jgi:hypothetical protein
VGFDLGEDAHTYVALAKGEVVARGVEGGVDREDLTIGEEVVEPRTALNGGEGGAEEFDALSVETGCGFLGSADGFAVGGVVHHDPPPPLLAAPPPPC